MTKKIYISGKITGLPYKQVKKKFNQSALFLKLKGYTPINPIEISPLDSQKKWIDYMVDDIAQLLDADAIYMLHDWGQSKGARIEYQIAKELEIPIIFQGEFNAHPITNNK